LILIIHIKIIILNDGGKYIVEKKAPLGKLGIGGFCSNGAFFCDFCQKKAPKKGSKKRIQKKAPLEQAKFS